jgi:hypothetical protein
MGHPFRPGERVHWWRRAPRGIEYPYRAEVLDFVAKRVRIAAEESDGSGQVIRHVAAESLQPIAVYYEKAIDQGPELYDPVSHWGRFTIFLEIGEDLRVLRQVNLFDNGNALSYDRMHWIDRFGMLGDAGIKRNRKEGIWGRSTEIEADEFEEVWIAAQSSPAWERQVAAELMTRAGAVPVWFRIADRRPPLGSRAES